MQEEQYIDHMKAVNSIFTPISTVNDSIDAWKYFLASGLAFAFLDKRDDTHQAVLSKMQEILGCKEATGVDFELNEIAETAAKTIDGIQMLTIDPMDIGEAIVNNAIYMAKQYEKGGYVSKDVCWTAFKLGLSCKTFTDVDVIAIHDPKDLKEILRVEPRATNTQRIDAPLNLKT